MNWACGPGLGGTTGRGGRSLQLPGAQGARAGNHVGKEAGTGSTGGVNGTLYAVYRGTLRMRGYPSPPLAAPLSQPSLQPLHFMLLLHFRTT